MELASSSLKVDFNKEAPADLTGMDVVGVRRVAAIFEDQIANGLHPGAQLVVLRHGQVVLDRFAGLADVRRKIPVTPETPFLTWSVSKAFTGICVHRLIEEEKIEWDAPVADYWPEFGCKGKEAVTIRQVFLHQAGIPLRGLYTQFIHWPNWERVTRNVANLQAEYPSGTRTAYHLVNYGFILGEVVRRVSGMTIEDFLRSTFLEPLGLKNTSYGLPPNLRSRAAQLYSGCPDQRLAVWAFRLPAIRGAILPAATLHSTARDLAVFYQMLINGGEYAGKRFLRTETIAAATSLGYEGYDYTMGRQMRWAHGFHLGGLHYDSDNNGAGMGKGSTEKTFGHFGQRTCMAWADPEASLVVAFTCNRLLSMQANPLRWQEISNAIWEAIER